MKNIEKNTLLATLKMNPFSFIQMSGGFNYLVYGFIVPIILLVITETLLDRYAALIVMLLAVIMALASLIRRGMDAGQTPLSILLTWGLSSWAISFMLAASGMTGQLLIMTQSFVLTLLIVYILNNAYLVYLFFAPQKELVMQKTSKTSMIVMGSLVLLLLVAIALPNMA